MQAQRLRLVLEQFPQVIQTRQQYWTTNNHLPENPMKPFFMSTDHQVACAQELLAAMARRHPRNNFMSDQFATNLLLREGVCVSLIQVQDGMRKLQHDALGVVIEDESGKMGFLWEQAPYIAQAKKKAAGESFMPTIHVDIIHIDDLNAYQDPLPEHVLQLRDNCAVQVSIPKDLSKKEAKRVLHFMKALINSNSIASADEWPFKDTRDEFDDAFDDLNDVIDDTPGSDDDKSGDKLNPWGRNMKYPQPLRVGGQIHSVS